MTLKEIKETLTSEEIKRKYNLILKEEDERALEFIYKTRQTVAVLSFNEIDNDVYLCMASNGIVTGILVEKIIVSDVIKIRGGASDITIFLDEDWRTK